MEEVVLTKTSWLCGSYEITQTSKDKFFKQMSCFERHKWSKRIGTYIHKFLKRLLGFFEIVTYANVRSLVLLSLHGQYIHFSFLNV